MAKKVSKKEMARRAAKRRVTMAKKARLLKAGRGVKKMGPVEVRVDTTRLLPDREHLARMLKTALENSARVNRAYESTHIEGNEMDDLFRRDKNAVTLPRLWRAGDGTIYRIPDMEEGHLRNTVSYLARRLAGGLGNAPWVSRFKSTALYLVAMLAECERRGLHV